MTVFQHRPAGARTFARHIATVAALAGLAACSSSKPNTAPAPSPADDPRVGLKAGLFDAEEAVSNMKVTAKAVSPEGFLGITNSDLAFTGKYAIQGNFNGFMVWDIANPAKPHLTTWSHCPASQSDVSVYKNLLFVSGENLAARLEQLTKETGACLLVSDSVLEATKATGGTLRG